MEYTFNARSFRSRLRAIADDIFTGVTPAMDDDSPSQLLKAMEQAIDVMERANADVAVALDNSRHVIEAKDVSQIGEYALSLLEGLVGYQQAHGDEGVSELMSLTVPVALWIAEHGGKLDNLDLVVNALAAYANELRDTQQLAELCEVIASIIDSVSDNVRQDLEQTNPMRPWRILNINYGIVATRSHDPELIDQAYATLVKNLPQDARQFFRESMQQMDIIGYPRQVRDVVEKYDRMWGAESTLH